MVPRDPRGPGGRGLARRHRHRPAAWAAPLTRGDAGAAQQRRILAVVLALNLLLVVLLTAAGVSADSSALIANELHNASDSAVYVISLFAVNRSSTWKRAAATASGVLLLLFATGVLADAVRRYVVGSEPVGPMMMGASSVAGGGVLVVGGLVVWTDQRWPDLPWALPSRRSR